MKSFFSGCLIIIAVGFLIGCGLNTFVFFVTPTLNQQKWNETKPERYSLNVYYGTLWSTFITYQEDVSGGITRRRRGNNFSIAIEQPTIDELFNTIKAQTLNPLAFLWLYSAEYDPVYGFPMRIVWNDFDLGEVTEIKDFTPE